LLRLFEPQVRPGFEWALPVDDADHEYLWSLDGTPREERWLPIPVALLTEGEDGTPLAQSDFPWLGQHVLVLRERAVAALAPTLRTCGELLPLDCPDAKLWLFHALTIADALDESAADITRYSDGEILAVQRYAFHPAKVPDAPIFKVPQLLRGSLFLTEEFVNQVNANGLVGFGSSAIWKR
jgi:hypothetical protein